MRAHVVPMSCEVNLWKNEASRLECTRTAYPRHASSAGAELVLPSHVLLQVRLRDRRLRTPHATKTFQIFLTNAFAHNDRHERIGGSGRTWTLATAASKSRMVTGISIWSCHHRHHASANSGETTKPATDSDEGLRRTCESARISAGVLPSIARRIAIMEASRQMLVMSAPE